MKTPVQELSIERTEYGPTRRLAEFAAKLTWHDLTPEVVAKLKLHILDTIGCGIFGASRPWSEIVRNVARRFESNGQCVLWGTSLRASGLTAALVNGTAAHGYELDDIYVPGAMHPGPPTVAAALGAVAQAPNPINGQQMLVAIAAGYEVGVRISACMGISHLLKGWHPTGTTGVFCAAAAAGRILELDTEKMVHALGTAGPHASGLIAAQYGGMAKRLYVGHAAQSGLFAASLAQDGFEGIQNVLEAQYGGYVRTFDGRGNPNEIVDGLGKRYEFMNTGFKRYPTAGAIHGGVDALDQIQVQHQLNANEVESITAYVSHSTQEHCGWKYVPKGATSAQMNLSFALANRLIRGRLTVAEFEEGNINSPEVLSLVEKITVISAEDINNLGEKSRYSTRLVVRAKNGKEYIATVHNPKGTIANPFDSEDVKGKFRDLVSGMLSADQIERIVETVLSLEGVDDIRELERILALRYC